jgi:hypothetical protein
LLNNKDLKRKEKFREDRIKGLREIPKNNRKKELNFTEMLTYVS